MEVGRTCVNGEWCWGRRKKMEEEKGRKKWGVTTVCGSWGRKKWRKKWKIKKNGGQPVWEFGVRRISKEKRWEREKMRGRLVVGGRVYVLRGERKKEWRFG